MARNVPWWNGPGMTTPATIAAAAEATDSLVESGRDYVVGSLDFGDGGPLAPIVTEGAIVRCPAGELWLVRPGDCKEQGWIAHPLTDRADRRPGVLPRQLGTAHAPADDILSALDIGLNRTAEMQKRSAPAGTPRVDALF